MADRTALLDQANADLRSFGRSVSHDLRGPIAATAQMLHVMLAADDRHPLAQESREVLALMASECTRMTRLVDELMLLAKADDQPMQRCQVSMRVLVEAVLADLRDDRTVVTVAPDLPEVAGDAILLRQVWQNLLANAFKFSARAEAPRVEVRWHREAAEYVFSVTDNGAGFDMAQAEQLFGAFRRLHSAADFPGTGVGLSIVKRIVHRHDGQVWATGKPGTGATFCFSLPVGLGDERRAAGG